MGYTMVMNPPLIQIAFIIIFIYFSHVTNFRFYVPNFFYSIVVSPIVLRGMEYGPLMNMSYGGLLLDFMHIPFMILIYLQNKNKIVVPNFNPLNYKHHHDKCIYFSHVKMLNLPLIFAPYQLQDMVFFTMFKMVTRSLVYIYVACRYSLCYNNFHKQLSIYRLARKSNCRSKTSIIKYWI